MNILAVCHYGLYQNFTFSFVHKQMKAFAAAGCRVRVIIPVPLGKQLRGKRLGPALTVQQQEGVSLYYVRYLSASNYGRKGFNIQSARLAIGRQLQKILKDFGPDVIHAHTFGLDSGIGAWLKKKLDLPLIVTTHGGDTERPLQNGEQDWLRGLCEEADLAVAVSQKLAGRLESCGTKTSVRTVLNGFALENMGEATEKDPFAMVQVGHLIPSKRTEITIRAFAVLHSRENRMRLTVIGAGHLRQRLEELVKELGVQEAVTFTGEIPNREVFVHMAKATYFVMPSKPEGFGIVYLEAMANRCITVGTEGEGIADLVESGRNGFLVPADDVQAVVSVIESCMADSEMGKRVAEAGYASAIGLTWENNAARYMALFEKEMKDR